MSVPVKELGDGFSIPSLGLGTWKMGMNDDVRDVAAIRGAIDRGVTHIDSAAIYANGHSEELVGEAIKDIDRDSLFVATKCPSWVDSAADTVEHCRESLKRLSLDYVDLYMIHGHDVHVDLRDVMPAYDQLADEGLVRNIGVSNLSVESLKLSQSILKHPIRVNQVHYNLTFRAPETTGLLEYCQQNDVIINAWRPLQYGEFGNVEVPVLDEICEKYNRSRIQVALNWLTTQANVVTLVKTSSMEHLEEDLGGVDWKMDEEDVERLRNEFPEQSSNSHVPLN